MTTRLSYRPSGRFHLSRTVALFTMGAALALLLAWLLMLAGEYGWYFVVITPTLLALPLPLVAYVGADWAQFRSPYLGAVLGALLGIVYYVGRYYVLLIYLAGPAVAPRIDVLPRFVAVCVNNQVVEDDGPAIRNRQSPAMNWLLFGLELSICAAMPASVWYTSSLRPFCERCRTWMSTKNTVVPAGSAHAVADALRTGQLPSLDVLEEIDGGLPPLFSRIQVVGCTHDGRDQEATFFLTAAEVLSQGEKDKANVILNRVALTPDEFLTLAEKCPGLMT